MRNKLLQAASKAAEEATTNERARCLWCIEEVGRELRMKLKGKLLTEAQVHVSNTKLKIAEAVFSQLRRAIVSGVRPPGGPESRGMDAADLQSPGLPPMESLSDG